MSVPRDPSHRDELDETLESALESMLAASPSDSQCARAVDRLSRPPTAQVQRPRSSGARTVKRFLFAAAATWLFGLLWLGAQTEAWGDVVVDYQTAGTSDQAPTTKSDAVPSSPILRFVLMVHVLTLSVALIGYLGVWVMTQLAWLRGMFGGQFGETFSRWSLRILLSSVVLYGFGIAVGCIWAWQAWGSPWRWDARESLALFTLGIAGLWYAQQPHASESSQMNGHELVRRRVLPCTVAFWMIVLLFLLAPIYASDIHEHGFGRFALVNMVSFVAAVNLALVGIHWAVCRLRTPVAGA